jgi:hypothetical protein
MTCAGAQEIPTDNVFLGPIPKRIGLFARIIKNAAFVCSVGTNPFQFHHYDLNCSVLFINGIQ